MCERHSSVRATKCLFCRSTLARYEWGGTREMLAVC